MNEDVPVQVAEMSGTGRVEIHLTGPHLGELRIDGHKIEQVFRLQFNSEIGEPNRLSVDVWAHPIKIDAVPVEVVIREWAYAPAPPPAVPES
jgi:hypothetical protein